MKKVHKHIIAVVLFLVVCSAFYLFGISALAAAYDLTNPWWFVSVIGCFALGAIGSLALTPMPRMANWWAHTFAAIGSLLAFILALFVMQNGPITLELSSTLPYLPIAFRANALSAFFVAIISVVAFAASIYGIGYMRKYEGKYSLGAFGFFYTLFIASLLLVVTANHTLYFMLAWEIMAITSYLLVIFEHRDKDNIHAGLTYLIMTHIGTACIIFSFLLLYTATGSFYFTDFSNTEITGWVRTLAFLLALVGFGTKAGVIPLHIWLPQAHPAAPSHVSALMSGVMIKTGIFMIIRFSLDFFTTAPLWWGVVILLLGAISSFLGVLHALAEHDLKRLLAFHSVENIGIILLGVGSSIVFHALGYEALSLLALAAGLFHTMNHAIFKALLFLSAGSVVYATHTRNMEEYGGLMKTMPLTGFFFLIGAAAISALPPLNGFASEWLTFQALFAGIATSGLATTLAFLAAAGSLAFTGGLAAACFVKAVGATFLAKPRSEEASHAQETSVLFHFGMGLLATLCVVLGVSVSAVIPRLESVARSLPSLSAASSIALTQDGIVQVGNAFSLLSLSALAIALVLIVLFVLGIVAVFTRKQRVQTNVTWDCGAPSLNARMEITATSFSRAIITVFRGIFKPTLQKDVEYHDAAIHYLPKAQTVTLHLGDIYQEYLYTPIQRGVHFVANRVKRVQSGNVNFYILYIFITLIGLLVWATHSV